jgi:ribosomal protein S18 acetylase RimI-like enzyme
MSLAIRDADLSHDRATLERFILGSNTYEAQWESDRRLDAAVGADYLPVLIERVTQQQGRIFVAENAGTLVGWTACYLEQHDAFVKDEERPFGYVAELFIDDAHRGLHIGRSLLKSCEDHFRALGVKSVLIGALAPNTRAVNAYLAAGFSDYAIEFRKRL